jgi:hypothetical protein
LAFLLLILELATCGALVTGVVALVRPIRWVSTRPRAFGLVAAGLVTFGVVGAIAPPPSAADLGVAKPAPAVSAAPAPATPSPPSRDVIDASFSATQSALLAAAKPCDAAMTKAAHTRGQYASYNVSVETKQICRQASIDIGHVRFADPAPSAAQDDLNKAVDCFALAYGLKSVAMEKAAALMDGDQRPSKVAEFRDTLSYAGEQHRACMEQYAAAAAAHGFAKQIGWTDRD